MKKLLLVVIFIFSIVDAPAQTSATENFISTATCLDADCVKKAWNVQYFDGLGRPKQVVNVKASPTGQDLVTTILYDGFGRQVDSWLPVPMASLNGGIQSGVESAAVDYYADQTPFSHQKLENSPLNRIEELTQAGDAWQNNPIRYEYLANLNNEVLKISPVTTWINGASTTSSLKIESYYAAATLYKNKVSDEDGNFSYEFKNGQGQTLMVRKMDGSAPVDTYYVYNEYDQLAFVISPLAAVEFKKSPVQTRIDLTVDPILNELCYQYKYDGRNRLVEKKLPGKDWEYMVYDKQDRLVLVQDGKHRTTTNNFGGKGWLFTKYDQWGRVAYTGFFSNTATRSSMQTALNNMAANASNNEVRTSSYFNLNGLDVYYSKNAFPTGSMTLLAVNYYDTYPTGTPFPTQNQVLGEDILQDTYGSGTVSTKSLPVASFVKNINDHQWTKNYSFYDKKGRSIASHSINHLGGSTVQHSLLDFTGTVQKTKTYHHRLSGEPQIVIEESFEYDNQNRLVKHYHEVIGKSPKELLAENTYDETGQLVKKKTGNNIQEVDYTYNIRGWLTGINVDKNTGNFQTSKLFNYKIGYNDALGALSTRPYAANPLLQIKEKYNGNIGTVTWKYNDIPNTPEKKYGYVYDGINRLLAGFYYQNTGNGHQFTEEHNEIQSYDLNGNISELRRFSYKTGTAPHKIDDLEYTYVGNRVTKITDTYGDSNGYEGGGRTISYDVNGNMTDMLDKGITAIQYNYLNLPTSIRATDEANTVNVAYMYRADGTKLRKTNSTSVTANTGITTVSVTDYLDGFQYLSTASTGGGILPGSGEFEVAMEREAFNVQPTATGTVNTILQFVPTPEGFYDFKENKYIYQYKDHLGNTRLSYAWNSTTGSIDVLDKNDYYPFGMNHLNPDAGAFFGQGSYKNYKYNGKELQETGMYDYGARMYMPDIGRWGVVDPRSQYTHETYSYVWNNPISFWDPTGMTGELATCPTCPDTAEFKPYIDDKNNTYVYIPETKTVEKEIQIQEVTLTGKAKSSDSGPGSLAMMALYVSQFDSPAPGAADAAAAAMLVTAGIWWTWNHFTIPSTGYTTIADPGVGMRNLNAEADDKDVNGVVVPKEKKVPVSGKTGKEAAKDAPSWAKEQGVAPNVDEDGKTFAERVLDGQYGKGKWNKGKASKGPGSEFNKIKKWGDRGFELPKKK